MSLLRIPARIPAPRNPQLDFKQRNLSKPFRFMPASAGLNLKDELGNMKNGDALRLDNLIPQPDGISTRNGRAVWTPTMGSPIYSLIPYAAPNFERLFAVTKDGAWFDVTSKGAPVDVVVPGEPWADGVIASAQILSTAGVFLMCVNDHPSTAPVTYNGSAWSTHAMTYAPDPTVINSFAYVSAHMGRLWFTAKNSMDLYYLQPASIGGALTKFSVGSLFKRGGYIMVTGTLTRDGGLGSDDLFVVISSKGEVLTYAGNNPASVNTWGLVGVYQIPPPVSRRCLSNMGSDLAVLTTRGLSPMAEVMRLASVQQSAATLTNRINSELGYQWESNWDEFGWELHVYPDKNLVILNVPISDTESTPFVMHAESGGWCRWLNYSATCFMSWNGRLFCGDAGGIVWEYTDDFVDDDPTGTFDLPITCEMMTAFDVMQSPGVKMVAAVRPIYKGPNAQLPVKVYMDYDDASINASVGVINIHGPPWNATKWNTAKWGPRRETVSIWQVSEGVGGSVAVGMKFQTNDNVTITGIDILYEEALPL